jgi:hypothetical protein
MAGKMFPTEALPGRSEASRSISLEIEDNLNTCLACFRAETVAMIQATFTV